MLTGSTSGLRSLPALSSQLLCRLWRCPALFVRAYPAAFVPLLCSRALSTSCHPRSMWEERNGPGNHDFPSTNSSSAHWLPTGPVVSTSGTHPLSCRPVPSFAPALSADNASIVRVAGVVTRGCQQHECTSRARGPRETPNHAKRKCPAQRRRTLLWVMLTSKTPNRAWAAYEELLAHQVPIPHHLLHQLARLLATIRPRTRTVHLQLLSVLRTLVHNHGRLRSWEWNTLIDSAGKQWHKTRMEDYEYSFDIFNKRGVLPLGNAEEAASAEVDSSVTELKPDIWTYTTLLSIATRSNIPLAVRHASSLLLASGLIPNRYTHLCLIRYFAFRNDLCSVRSTLRKMTEQGLEVGLDGVNACLWAYARSGRFDIAFPIYRVLRSNAKPAPDLRGHDVEEDARYICDTVGLDILDNLQPDEITYTTMIQSLAYHGDLRNALSVFVDMLSIPDHGGATRRDAATSMAAFRGLFLGFARHGRDPDHRPVRAESIARLFPSSQANWDQDTLDTVFAAFLQLPALPKPTERVLYWILVGFDKTSGNDCAKLRGVWRRLEAKYGGGWGGRLEEIRRSIFPP